MLKYSWARIFVYPIDTSQPSCEHQELVYTPKDLPRRARMAQVCVSEVFMEISMNLCHEVILEHFVSGGIFRPIQTSSGHSILLQPFH